VIEATESKGSKPEPRAGDGVAQVELAIIVDFPLEKIPLHRTPVIKAVTMTVARDAM
jgi:hypothetical protein